MEVRTRFARQRGPGFRTIAVWLWLAATIGPAPPSVWATEPDTPPGGSPGASPAMVALEERWEGAKLRCAAPAGRWCGLGQPPMIAGGVIVATSSEAVHGFDPATGDLLWRVGADQNGPLSFSPVAGHGMVLVARQPEGSSTATLTALELGTPPTVVRWAQAFDPARGMPYGHPAFTDDGGVVVSLYRPPDASRPEGEQGEAHGFVVLDALDGSERWHLFPTDCWAIGGDLLVAPMDTYLGGEGTPRGITGRDLATGEERWFLRGQQANRCPAVTGDSVYVDRFEENGVLAVMAATGQERFRIALPRVRSLTPAGPILLVEQGVLVPEDEPDQVRIVALDAVDARERWASEPFQDKVEQVAASGDHVFVALEDHPDVLQGGLLVLDAATGREAGFIDTAILGFRLDRDTVYTVSSDDRADDRGSLRAYSMREVPVVADLAAMTLTPGDLAAAGLDGYVVADGGTAFADGIIASTAAGRGLSEADVAAVLEGAGLSRRHESALYHPVDPADPESDVDLVVSSYAMEFRDQAGAAAAWEFLEDETGSATARDLPELRDLGDGSEVTVDSGEDADGSPYHLLDLTIRTGPRILGVAVIDWSGGEPSPVLMHALGERLLERAERVTAHPTAGLGSRVVRVVGPDTTPILDRYTLQDGVPLPIAGEPPPEVRERDSDDVLNEPSDRYEVQVHLQRPDGDAWVLVDLVRYVRHETAADALASSRQDYEGSPDPSLELTDLTELTPGAFAYAWTDEASGRRYTGVQLLVDTTFAMLQSQTASEVDAIDAMRTLAEAQRTCLIEGCAAPVEVPEELTR